METNTSCFAQRGFFVDDVDRVDGVDGVDRAEGEDAARGAIHLAMRRTSSFSPISWREGEIALFADMKGSNRDGVSDRIDRIHKI
jgi:hypothetical protein